LVPARKSQGRSYAVGENDQPATRRDVGQLSSARGHFGNRHPFSQHFDESTQNGSCTGPFITNAEISGMESFGLPFFIAAASLTQGTLFWQPQNKLYSRAIMDTDFVVHRHGYTG